MTEQPVAFEYTETGSGPALLFLPGSFSTGMGWKAVMGILGDGYRVVTTSLLGYGATPDIRPDGNATMAQQVCLIDRIIDQIGTPLPSSHPAEIAALVRRQVDAAPVT